MGRLKNKTMLEGKAKIEFEKWFKENHPVFDLESDWESIGFYSLPSSMQFGVIQDWADSLGIHMQIGRQHSGRCWLYNIGIGNEESDTRAEARKAAITKLSELINNKYK